MSPLVRLILDNCFIIPRLAYMPNAQNPGKSSLGGTYL